MTKKCIPCGTAPTPYYKDDKNSVTQNHATILRDTAYAAGIRIREEFTVPAINADIQVCSKELVNVVVGSYVWNPSYGYLKIVHWDSCEGKIGLLNDDINGAAIPGTVVSEGSLWAVTARPCCADQDNFSLFPFLAEDYVIPAVSDSVTLAVTSTFGLIQGTNVRIGANIYFLEQINSSLEIIVTNEGAGGTPGDIVEARDVNGDLQYLITQAVVSACTSPGADAVKLIGCDGANEAILDGEFAGQVPVLQDPTTDEVRFQLLDTGVRVCTSLTSALNVLSATPSYTIEVDDESIFSIGEVLQINFGSLRWEITDNTTPGELDITSTTGNPGSNFTVPSGSSVCLQYSLETEIEIIQSILNDGWNLLSDTGSFYAFDIFQVLGDVTSLLKKGQKIKLLLDGNVVYGNVKDFVFGSITVGYTAIALIPNSDYILTNDPITIIEISNCNPPDFPAYFNYSVNLSLSEFSSITAQDAYYTVEGSQVSGQGVVGGTSNSVNFSMNLPVEPELISSLTLIGQTYQNIDNGADTGTSGTVISLGGTTATLFQAQDSSIPWTNSGAKFSTFEFCYIIKQ